MRFRRSGDQERAHKAWVNANREVLLRTGGRRSAPAPASARTRAFRPTAARLGRIRVTPMRELLVEDQALFAETVHRRLARARKAGARRRDQGRQPGGKGNGIAGCVRKIHPK